MGKTRTRPDYRALFEGAPGLYLVLAPDLSIVAVSDAYLAATMTRRAEILGRGIFEVFPDNPDDPGATGVANLRASLERVLATGRADAMAVQKYDVRRPEELGGGFEERYWSPVNSPVLGRGAKLRYIIHRVEDVTDFVRLEQAGRAQHDLTERLKEQTGRMEVEVFRRAQELQALNAELHKLRDELEARVEERTAELSRANASLAREIAERGRAEQALQQSEEQLRQAQKMEAVGRLAGGIAHDFNNLLSVVLSYSALLLSELPAGAHGRAELEEVKRAGERAADLTRQLLAFSRQQVLELRVVDLNQIVAGAAKMLGRLLGEDIDLATRLALDLARVRADRGQVEQVIMNLAVNARDAMPNGGRLTIETSNVVLDESYARQHLGAKPGPHVMLAVSDTGVGMDKATQARAFEPFFTTKDLGKGTGLGLSTVFGIVKQSGGNIWLYSEPGKGTTFRIYFPFADGEPERRAPAPPARASHLGRAPAILLVEDEAQVRAVAAEILKKAGFEVLVADGPVSAMRLAEASDEHIDLLVTDVVMPKMNGRELCEWMRLKRPALPVLFMSGYTDDVVLHHGVLDEGVAFLQKPLTPEALLGRVSEVLSAAPARAPGRGSEDA